MCSLPNLIKTNRYDSKLQRQNNIQHIQKNYNFYTFVPINNISYFVVVQTRKGTILKMNMIIDKHKLKNKENNIVYNYCQQKNIIYNDTEIHNVISITKI